MRVRATLAATGVLSACAWRVVRGALTMAAALEVLKRRAMRCCKGLVRGASSVGARALLAACLLRVWSTILNVKRSDLGTYRGRRRERHAAEL